MAYLALIRHGLSEWNKTGLWTGLTDISLAPEGIEQARQAGEALKDIHFDVAYVSSLIRAKQTLDEILKVFGYQIPTTYDKALDERDYGIYTGKNKFEVEKELGEEKFLKIRREWDTDIAQGESLKQVYERAVPYFEQNILPVLKEGNNVIVSAHGNSLRALVKHLDNIPDDEVSKLNIATGEIYLYEFDENGLIVEKKIIGSQGGQDV